MPPTLTARAPYWRAGTKVLQYYDKKVQTTRDYPNTGTNNKGYCRYKGYCNTTITNNKGVLQYYNTVQTTRDYKQQGSTTNTTIQQGITTILRYDNTMLRTNNKQGVLQYYDNTVITTRDYYNATIIQYKQQQGTNNKSTTNTVQTTREYDNTVQTTREYYNTTIIQYKQQGNYSTNNKGITNTVQTTITTILR